MIHFIVGTRAQLLKMAPIMAECERRQLQWRWVYTAQHKETMEEIIHTFGLPQPHYTIVKWQTEAKSLGKFGYWFLKMLAAVIRSRKILDGQTGKRHIVLTHGDTTTTWIAALMGRLTRTHVMHVESGLRSFNLFKPFPEEINRLLTFRLSTYYACPGDWAVENLRKYKGTKINTFMNTQADTVKYGLEHADRATFDLPKTKYVVASLHRYENIFNKERFSQIIDQLEVVAQKFSVQFVQHPATLIQLDKLDLRRRLTDNPNITLLPRLDYLPFIKAIKHSEFVITDGGGNQEELYHMGKPTLIFRNETERQEGLGSTAVISKFDPNVIKDFMNNYAAYQHPPVASTVSPSKLIVDVLAKDGFGG